MSLKVSGKVHKIFDEQQINDSLKKREFVIETDEKYPQFVKFELIKERCDLIGSYKEGDTLEVEFNLRGREWNDKFYVNLHAWRITALQVASEQKTSPALDDSADDDLPF